MRVDPLSRRRLSLRWSITIGATAIVMFVLIVTALAVSGLLRRSIAGETEALLDDRVDAVGALITSSTLPKVLEPTGREVGQVQVVDSGRRIVSSTPGIAQTSRLDLVEPPPVGDEISTTADGSIIDDDPGERYLLIARTVAGPAGDDPLTVYAVTSLRPAVDAQNSLEARLLLVLPVLAWLTGVLIHQVVGRAMRPMEAMRSQVEQISATDLSARVVPPASDDELARLGTTLNQLLQRLDDAATRQQVFAASASHELRSPLSAIRTDLEVGLAYPERTDWQRTATDALVEISRLEQLSTDLRALTKRGTATAGATSDLVGVVEAEIGRRNGSPIGFEASASSLHVELSEDEVVQIVRNLLTNAERHAISRIKVDVYTTEIGLVLAVSNDGPAIASEDRERVFEPFTRLDEARSLDAGGSGLGLAIVRSIVAAAGGTVVVAETDDGDVAFVTTLPNPTVPPGVRHRR